MQLFCAALPCCSETTTVTEIGPYKVPEGIVVWPMIYALQNSIHNWEDPEDFNPVSHILQPIKLQPRLGYSLCRPPVTYLREAGNKRPFRHFKQKRRPVQESNVWHSRLYSHVHVAHRTHYPKPRLTPHHLT